MKSLIELVEVNQQDLPEIYCDMDEVLVAFREGADKAAGGSWI